LSGEITEVSLWDFFRLVLGYDPHEGGQIEFHASTKRFRILACGTRWGKTLAAAMEAIALLIFHVDWRGWIVAPSYELASKTFRYVLEYSLAKIPHLVETYSFSRQSMFIRYRTGGELFCKSADNPISLLGEALDFIILDEGTATKEEIWPVYCRPRLADREGSAIFIGTPKGRNWFYPLFMRGQDPLEEDYQSWHHTTMDNPYIKPEEIKKLEQDMPKRAYEQEVLAMFLSDAGGVFHGVRDVFEGPYPDNGFEPEAGHSYVMGVDLAKYQDFTVITIWDRQDRGLKYFDRFQRIDWHLQRAKIQAAAKRYNDAQAWVDSTGVGDPNFEELVRMGVKAQGYNIVTGTKQPLIDNAVMAIEAKTVHGPEIPQLVNEMEIYEYEMTHAGNLRMNAPSGYHDDCVISLALAVWGLGKGSGEPLIAFV